MGTTEHILRPESIHRESLHTDGINSTAQSTSTFLKPHFWTSSYVPVTSAPIGISDFLVRQRVGSPCPVAVSKSTRSS